MLSLNPDSRAPTQVARGGALPGNHRAGKTSRLQSALIWRLGPSGSLICPKTHTGSTWLFPACVVGKAWGICLWESRGALRCINPEFPRPWYHFRPSRCVSRPHGHSRPPELTRQRGWTAGARAVGSVALACTLLTHLPVRLWEIKQHPRQGLVSRIT